MDLRHPDRWRWDWIDSTETEIVALAAAEGRLAFAIDGGREIRVGRMPPQGPAHFPLVLRAEELPFGLPEDDLSADLTLHGETLMVVHAPGGVTNWSIDEENESDESLSLTSAILSDTFHMEAMTVGSSGPIFAAGRKGLLRAPTVGGQLDGAIVDGGMAWPMVGAAAAGPGGIHVVGGSTLWWITDAGERVSTDIDHPALALGRDGRWLYATRDFALHRLDVRDPANPRSLRPMPSAGYPRVRIHDVQASGDRLLLRSDARDTRQAFYLTLNGDRIASVKTIDLKGAPAPVLTGSRLWQIRWNEGENPRLEVADTTPIGGPYPIGRNLSLPTVPLGFAASGSVAVLGVNTPGLLGTGVFHTIQARGSTGPEFSGALTLSEPLDGLGQSIATRAGRAWIATGAIRAGELVAIDITLPDLPEPLAAAPLGAQIIALDPQVNGKGVWGRDVDGVLRLYGPVDGAPATDSPAPWPTSTSEPPTAKPSPRPTGPSATPTASATRTPLRLYLPHTIWTAGPASHGSTLGQARPRARHSVRSVTWHWGS